MVRVSWPWRALFYGLGCAARCRAELCIGGLRVTLARRLLDSRLLVVKEAPPSRRKVAFQEMAGCWLLQNKQIATRYRNQVKESI